jgi:hypothetical protein
MGGCGIIDALGKSNVQGIKGKRKGKWKSNGFDGECYQCGGRAFS